MFDADIGEAIKIAYSQNIDEEAIHLMRTAHILRKDILDKKIILMMVALCQDLKRRRSLVVSLL